MMQFEWNEDKAQANLKKHKIAFEDALYVFTDHYRIETIDNRSYYGEERWNTVGIACGVLIFVTYTVRGENIRIISARKANGQENQKYRQGFF